MDESCSIMLINCFYCGQDNHLPNSNYEGYESYQCWSCLKLSWLEHGLYSYMARTEMNELKAWRDLRCGDTFSVEGKVDEF
jgi:hypothetical protein